MSTLGQLIFRLFNFWLRSTNVLLASAILIFIVFITIRVYKWKNSRLVQFASQLPGPTTLPLIGNGLDFIGNGEAMMQKFYQYESRYKSPYRLWFGSHLMVCISKPEELEVVFGNSKLLGKPEIFRCFQDFWGDSIFSGPVHIWKKNRKRLQPALGANVLENYISRFIKKINCTVDNLKCEIGQGEFDLWNYLPYLSFDIIADSILNTEFDSETKMALDLHNYLTVAFQICMYKMMKPWLHLKFISDFIYKNSVNKIRSRLLNLAKQAVKDNITGIKNYNQNQDNNIMNEDCLKSVRSSKSFLSIAYELGQEAGNETLAFDEILTMVTGDKLYDELYEVFGDEDREADTNDMKKLIYLEQVIKEALRRFSLVPIMFREVKEDTKIGEYIYPAGTEIIIPVFAAHINPTYYKNPSVFDPEHFSEDAVNSRHKLTFIPFSAGPRNCIGQAYAMLEMKLTLSTLLRHFQFNTTVKEKDIKINLGFVITSKNGYKVSITLRDRRPSYMKDGK